MTSLRELVDLRALILERPDDSSLRRVFADALIERGNPRGEFTRVQCELADLGLRPNPLRARLQTMEGQLLHRHQVRWFTPLRIERFRQQVAFVRGFVERWSCHPERFQRCGAWAVSHHPLRSIALRRVEDFDLRELSRLSAFTAMREVRLSMRGPPWLPVARVPFTRLEKLTLEGSAFNPGPGFEALCAAPWWKGLESVDLAFRLVEPDVNALEASGLLSTVKHLGVRAGALQRACPELTSLKLTIWMPDRHPLAAIFALVPKLSSLTLDSLSSTAIPEDALGGLPERITSLRLEHMRLSEANVDALVGNANLKSLFLMDCKLSDVSFDRLRLRWDDRGWRCSELDSYKRLPRS
ncbi:MAG: TIGR02996 domain-containing protein [Archangium sp.]|nr:TIGR02996 domain-containing protein [Archangium sp.]